MRDVFGATLCMVEVCYQLNDVQTKTHMRLIITGIANADHGFK